MLTRRKGPYNRCPVEGCTFESTSEKFCPLHGCETLHLPAEQYCASCAAVVWYVEAIYCATCGRPLKPAAEVRP